MGYSKTAVRSPYKTNDVKINLLLLRFLISKTKENIIILTLNINPNNPKSINKLRNELWKENE